MTGRPFWIDRAYDRENADPGMVSRYAKYVADLQFTVPSGRLPYAGAYPRLEFAADEAVTVLVAELNRIITPVIEAIGKGLSI